MHHVISREIITGKVGAKIVFPNGMDKASIMSYAPVNLQFRLRYDGAVIEKGSSIDELFAGLNSPLYYLLEEKGPENSVRKNS